MSCKGTMRCPGASGSSTYDAGSPCTWTRKLCVSCSTVNGVVKIRVQTNNLPNHCMNATVNNAKEQVQDWTVTWQPDVSNIKNYKDSDFDTSAKTEEILCDIQRTAKSNMNAASAYSLTKADGKSSDPIGT